jgi:hypothetical protein
MFSQFKDRVARRNKGNGQSTTQHNRLSKPRTNTNSKSASPIVSNDIPYPISPHADLSAKNREQIRESMLSPTSREVTSAIWSDQDVVDTEPAVEGRGRRSTVVSRSNSRAHSRSGSALRSFVRSRRSSTTNLKNLPESKVSLVSTTQSDVEAAIRLLQEVKKNASPEDLVALRKCSWWHALPTAITSLSCELTGSRQAKPSNVRQKLLSHQSQSLTGPVRRSAAC